MAQAKKKQSTKTAKKQTRSTKSSQARRQGSQSSRKTECSNRERNHIYLVTALGMITAILLCANVVIMMF